MSSRLKCSFGYWSNGIWGEVTLTSSILPGHCFVNVAIVLEQQPLTFKTSYQIISKTANLRSMKGFWTRIIFLGRSPFSVSSPCEFLMFSPVLELVVSMRIASFSTPSSSARLANRTASGSSQASVKFPRPPLKRTLGAKPFLRINLFFLFSWG